MARLTGIVALSGLLLLTPGASAQEPGPHFRTVAPGIHVRAQKAVDSNCTIILTNEGVVLIDSGHNPPDSRAVLEAVKKLTPLPVRILINTEPHADHTSGHYVFSPPAVIVAASPADRPFPGAHPLDELEAVGAGVVEDLVVGHPSMLHRRTTAT